MYSTAACYGYATNQAQPNGWTVKYDDFLPYSSTNHAFWTGFYTSRPTVKGYERVNNNFLQVPLIFSGVPSPCCLYIVESIGNINSLRVCEKDFSIKGLCVDLWAAVGPRSVGR